MQIPSSLANEYDYVLETLNNLCTIGWPIPDWFVYNAIDDARECCSFFNDVVFLYIVIYLLVLNVLKLQIHQRIILLILVNGSDAFLSCSVKKMFYLNRLYNVKISPSHAQCSISVFLFFYSRCMVLFFCCG